MQMMYIAFEFVINVTQAAEFDDVIHIAGCFDTSKSNTISRTTCLDDNPNQSRNFRFNFCSLHFVPPLYTFWITWKQVRGVFEK